MNKEVSKIDLYVTSTLKAFYEVGFIFLPVLAWSATLLSTGESVEEIRKLAAWPFLALALFSSALKDGIAAYHRDNKNDKRQRDVVITASIIGIVLSTVLLTLAILDGQQADLGLFSQFYEFVFLMVGAGVVVVLATKIVLIQRVDFEHYL